MFCRNCGRELVENESICPVCGASANGDTATGHSALFYSLAYPMKWYKFLIYFALFAGAVANVIGAIGTISGFSTLSAIYAKYPAAVPVDICAAVISLALAALDLYTRHALVSYKKIAPMLLCISYAIPAVHTVVAVSIGTVITEGLISVGTNHVIGIIVNIIMVVANYVYFKKRQDMFVN